MFTPLQCVCKQYKVVPGKIKAVCTGLSLHAFKHFLFNFPLCYFTYLIYIIYFIYIFKNIIIYQGPSQLPSRKKIHISPHSTVDISNSLSNTYSLTIVSRQAQNK